MTDLEIAKKYINKASQAKKDGYEFDLSFISFKNMMRAKKCKITKEVLTTPNSNGKVRFSDRTIDRIDNKKGYVHGNVMTVSSGINRFKGILENSQNPLTPDVVIAIAKLVKGE